MGHFSTVSADDANHAFSDPDGFAEALSYRKAVTGATRTVYGVVDRLSPEPGPGRGLVPRIIIGLPNNTTRGVTTAEWKNGDAILVAERYGDEAKWHQLHWPNDASAHDSAWCQWEAK